VRKDGSFFSLYTDDDDDNGGDGGMMVVRSSGIRTSTGLP